MKPALAKCCVVLPVVVKVGCGKHCAWPLLLCTVIRAPWGDKFRRLRAKLGAPKAITAMAHQLARIIWHLIVYRVPFDLTVFAAHEQINQTRRLKSLASAARHMGYQLTPLATSDQSAS
jgi:hypothetical protein